MNNFVLGGFQQTQLSGILAFVSWEWNKFITTGPKRYDGEDGSGCGGELDQRLGCSSYLSSILIGLKLLPH